jgi:hypothetical protein
MRHARPMPPEDPQQNGHGGPQAAFRRPAPHPVPSLAAKMAEADAARDAAAKAELAQRTAALHEHIGAMLGTDPAALLMALPDLFGASLVEMVAAGVQLGLARAAAAEQEKAQQAATPEAAAARKPILLAQTGNVVMAAQAAMTGMPPPPPQ